MDIIEVRLKVDVDPVFRNLPGKAALYYARALKKNPDSPQIYRALGYCLDQLHQKDKARKLLEKADQLDEDALKRDKSNKVSNNKRFPFVLI